MLEAYDYTGIDFGLEYYVYEDLTFYGNYSWSSDNVFTSNIIGSDVEETASLTTPKNKFRLGANYTPQMGFRANLSFQYDESFEARLGQFSGMTGSRALVDLGIGYKFNYMITLNVSAQNLFDNEYKAFPLMPKIGGRVLATLRFNFGAYEKM